MSNSNQISKSFCVLPWVHLNVQPNGDIYPCCMAPYGKSIGNTTDNTLEEIWNGEDMKTIRKEMLVGERPKLCERCFLIEDSGLLSPRNTHNHFFDKDVNELIKDTNPETGHNDKFVLKYWDFRWSNICNFKCRMCGAFSSSKWYEDE
jgi:radical SAM protein with 4Fe4S-binding SPASM domain